MSTLTNAQLPALNTAIKADATLNALPNNSVGNETIMNAFNANQAPDWWVWKSNVTMKDIAKCFNGAEISGLTANNHTRLQTVSILYVDGMDPSLPDMRFMLDDILGTGSPNSKAKLLTLYKRLSTRAEKLYSIPGTNTPPGNGTNAAPQTLVYQGMIDMQDVESARNLG